MGGLEAIDPRYAVLYDRASRTLAADDRVRRVELSGSVSTNTADRWSDLDLQVITDPERHQELLADWPTWLAAITPTVFARTPLAPFIINAVTDEGLTLDLAVYADGSQPPPFRPAADYVVGMLSGKRFAEVADALEYAVAEQLRGLAGPFLSLLQRDEHVRHLTGVPHLLGLLTTVFLAETGAAPPGKHWNATFTEEQRAAVAALPPVAATREDIVAFGLGLAELMITRARPLFERYDLVWPDALAAVAARRLLEVERIDASAWLR